MSPQEQGDHADYSYAGRGYTGGVIRFDQKPAWQSERSTTRSRSARPPDPAHQQGHFTSLHPADDNYSSDSFGSEVDGGDYPDEPVRLRTSAVRYDLPSPGRQTTTLAAKPTRVIKQRRVDRASLVIWLCLALIAMVVGWWLLSWVANWWQGVQDNLKYGTPRTFQVDQYVGLGDSPDHPDHFIALNLHGVIEVVQINPLDSAKDTAITPLSRFAARRN